MNNAFIGLVIGEIIVILIIVVIKLIFHILEKRKINSVLNFIEKYKKDKKIEKKFKECIDIVKKNNKEE